MPLKREPMTGRDFRKMREELGISVHELAQRLHATKDFDLRQMERTDRVIVPAARAIWLAALRDIAREHEREHERERQRQVRPTSAAAE